MTNRLQKADGVVRAASEQVHSRTRSVPTTGSQIDDLALACRDSAWACIVRIGGKRIHKIVIVRRIMVKQAKLLCTGFIRQANAARPRGMAPTLTRSDFIFRERGVVNDQIRTSGKRDQFTIALAGKACSVADQRERASVVFEAVTTGSIRVIQPRGVQRYALIGPQDVAGPEIVILDPRLEYFDFDRKQRRAHQLAHDLFDVGRGQEITCPDSDFVTFSEKWGEERQANDMIEMTMGQENIDVANGCILDKCIAERSQAGARIEDKHVVTAAHFDAGGVAAIADGFRSGTGDATADSPEANPHGGF